MREHGNFEIRVERLRNSFSDLSAPSTSHSRGSPLSFPSSISPKMREFVYHIYFVILVGALLVGGAAGEANISWPPSMRVVLGDAFDALPHEIPSVVAFRYRDNIDTYATGPITGTLMSFPFFRGPISIFSRNPFECLAPLFEDALLLLFHHLCPQFVVF